MVWVDLLFFVALASFVVLGWMRGVAHELVSTVGWLLAIGVATKTPVVLWVLPWLPVGEVDSALRTILSVILVILLARVALEALAMLIASIFSLLGATVLYRLLGAMLGALKVGLITTVLVMLTALTSWTQLPFWQNSMVVPYFEAPAQQLSRTLQMYLPEIFAELHFPERAPVVRDILY